MFRVLGIYNFACNPPPYSDGSGLVAGSGPHTAPSKLCSKSASISSASISKALFLSSRMHCAFERINGKKRLFSKGQIISERIYEFIDLPNYEQKCC